MQLQQDLGSRRLYQSSVDGLYGKNTEKALKAYNQKYLGGISLGNNSNVSYLFASILAVGELKNDDPKTKKKNIVPDNIQSFKVASGTGFFISEQGHIITNHHVIEDVKK